MSRLKVALFTGNYNHIRDGVSMTLNRLVAFLEENDVDVLVFGPTKKDPEIEHSGTLLPVPSIAMPGRGEYRISTGFPSARRKDLEAFDPDLIHIATPDLLGYKAMRWALKNNKPIVSSFHTHFTSYLKYYKMGFLESLMWKYLRWFYGNCIHTYVPSPAMASDLKDSGIETDMRIWARGVEMDIFNPEKQSEEWREKHGFGKDDVVVTFVSRLVWEKNLKIFADVVKLAKRKNDRIKAMIVGEGPALDELKELMPDAVYTGFLTGNELATSYASSDIFFFPSDTETFGNVTLEAMASGLPCVVADAAGSISLVEHEVNGYRVSVKKVRLFTEAIRTLASDKELRTSMGAASLKKSQTYSWNQINNTLLGYYSEALNSKK